MGGSTGGTDVLVLVVGAGPVGTALALELHHHGVRCVVVDRAFGASRHPKMDLVNGRSMELLARLGLADRIRALGVPSDQAFTFHWSETLAQRPVAEWSHPSVDDLRATMAATNDGGQPREPYQRVTGSRLEQLGRDECAALGLLREGWTVTALRSDGDGAVVHVVETATGTGENIRARFVVACDGATSTVRGILGIPVDEHGPQRHHCITYFRSADPALTAHGRFFLLNATRGLTVVSRDGRDHWTATFPLPDDRPFDGDPVQEIRRRLGFPIAVDEVLSVARWTGRFGVARHYRVGPVFLAGDAAHQFFPTGGHGANTGLADAVDLGWKLAATVNGWAGPGLLDSYENERRPVALFNREMAFNLLEVWRRFPVLAADGAGRSQLAGFLHQDRHQIDNHGIHFGYRYRDSPVVVHEDGVEPPWHWDRIVATTWPGGRVPSIRLADGTELFDLLGPELTLVDCTGGTAGKPIARAAEQLGVPLSLLGIDDPGVRRVWERDLVLVRPDHHVAWRGDESPADVTALLDRVRGR